MVENQQELEFDHELVRLIFAGIINVARHRADENRPVSPAEHSSMQEADEVDGSQKESKASIERSKSELDRSMIVALNELKDKFKIIYRSDEQAETQLTAEEEGEKCLIKISNFREDTQAQSTSKLDIQSQASGVLVKEDSKTQLRSETPQTTGSGKDKKEESKGEEEKKDGES